MEQQKTVRVSMEVRNGTARFRVDVQAASIRRALSVVGNRYPHGEARVIFPIDPEGFFVEGPAAERARLIEPPERVAA